MITLVRKLHGYKSPIRPTDCLQLCQLSQNVCFSCLGQDPFQDHTLCLVALSPQSLKNNSLSLPGLTGLSFPRMILTSGRPDPASLLSLLCRNHRADAELSTSSGCTYVGSLVPTLPSAILTLPSGQVGVCKVSL